MTSGIRIRHSKLCPSRTGAACRCRPTYQASVGSSREGKRLFKTFASLAEAKAWRTEAHVALRRGTMRARGSATLRQAAEAWLEGVKSGAIRNRSGHPYKPSAIRGYEAALVTRVLPELGGRRLSEIRRVDLQDFADRLCADGLDPSTVRNTLMPLRAIFRRAVARGEVAVNPTSGLELPAMEGARDRMASPAEAAGLLAALPEKDRALWATAMYAGLLRGELLALRWEDVNLAAGVIHVERSWDAKEGAVGPKSCAGRRTVPIPAVLGDYLVEHKLRSGRRVGLVFGTDYAQPFTPSNVRKRANAAWLRAGLEPIGLHECRHTFASLMIAASVNAKSLSAYMGHSSVTITLDRYGHLMPGNESQAAQLLDSYLARAVAPSASPA
ncbi:MAG: site-specific integrase [Actinomycetota bacterium]|nr:site-specific integrase [Actinomycetota bacterium]